MRKRLLSCLALGLLAGAACAIQALPSRSRQAHATAPASSGLNPASSADRQLQAFDAAHPQCQLWTNWQKMCSRTGPDGATVCVTDPGRPVRPSEPFCTAGTEAEASPSRAQIASYRRFCRFRPGQEGNPFHGCEGAENRPFNGRRVAARLHQWCDLWVDGDYRMVCRSGNLAIRNVPRCDSLARSQFEAPSRLMCARRSMPSWCRTPGLLGDGPQYPYPEVILPLGYSIGNATVVGVYCREHRQPPNS
jgi:hypothetical protein